MSADQNFEFDPIIDREIEEELALDVDSWIKEMLS
jgi:hypothetical protein